MVFMRSGKSLLSLAARSHGNHALKMGERSFHGAVARFGPGGHHYPPPLAPFQRIPARAEPMTENSDAIWDDGVAPELALDFDAPHISSTEALYTWLGALTMFAVVYQGIKLNCVPNGEGNPALKHASDCVVPDYGNHAETPCV